MDISTGDYNGSVYYSDYSVLDVVGDYIYTGSMGEVDVHLNRYGIIV